MNELEKKNNESTYQYIKRIVQAKDTGDIDLDYSELSPHIFGKEYSSDVCRRMYYGVRYLIKIIETEGLTLKPTSQLEDIKKQIGELEVKRQEIKNKNGQFNRIKKQLIKSIEISNDIKDLMLEQGMNIQIPSKCYEPININEDRTMIVCLSDLHIGYEIKDCKGNSFNLEIANKRMDKFVTEIYKYCSIFEIDNICVRGLGDFIEHCYMRGNQGVNSELNQSEQIVYVTELIYKFLTQLSEFAYVNYLGISGNHDRSCGEKSLNFEGDNANYIINRTLYNYNELANNPRLKIHELNYLQKEINEVINGVKCKFIHGDEKLKNPKRLFDSESTMDKEMYDLLIKGHLHNFNVTSQNSGGSVIGCGCLSGYNDYSARFGCNTYASQTLIIVSNGEVELIKDVNLQIN